MENRETSMIKTRTDTIIIYEYADLSDTSKLRAWENSLPGFDNSWSEENVDSLKAFADVFPVKLRNWSYGARDAGVDFDMTCSDAVEELTGHRLAKYLWNNYRSQIYAGKYYSTPGQTVDGTYSYKKRHSKISLESNCPLTGDCADEDLLAEIFAFMKKPDSRTFRELLADCFSDWVKFCEKELDYATSQKAFKESCEMNKWEFTEAGKPI